MIQLSDVLAMSPDDRDRLIGEKLFERPGYPSTDAGDDIAVHMWVCETWDAQGLLGNYFHALEELLCKEGGEEVDEDPSLYSMMHYRAGMFSTVALYVILHYEEWGKSDVATKLRERRSAQVDREEV